MKAALPVLDVPHGGPAADVASRGARELVAQAHGPRSIRSVRTLRISVTDHCNFRCIYCMPEEGLEWLPRDELLGYEEITHVARAALELGIRDFKLTGGEPLLRRDLPALVGMLRGLPGCGELSLTTNGWLLERLARPLREAGLDRVTLSLDTLDPQRFRTITRTGDLERVLAGLREADGCGLGPVKINVVVMRSFNLDELPDLAAITLAQPRTVRFIEFMPLARSRIVTDPGEFVPYAEMRRIIESAHGPLEPLLSAPDAGRGPDPGWGPARLFRLPGAAGRIGFIHAMSQPFCSTCNRLRLTPEGRLRSCLFDGGEVDVRPLLRPVVRRQTLRQALIACASFKPLTHSPYGDRQMSRIGG